MSLWAIENLDECGEGMFVCEAWSKAEALRLHARKNKGMKVTSCEKVGWVDLALVTGERGENYYFERQRGERCHGTVKSIRRIGRKLSPLSGHAREIVANAPGNADCTEPRQDRADAWNGMAAKLAGRKGESC